MPLHLPYIKTTNSLETDPFINALRRFVARRGNIRLLRSNQGTNIVGADTELQRAFAESTKAIQDYLRENGADFITKRNPPTVSHMGGIWEWQIRSARSILMPFLKDNEVCLTMNSFVRSCVRFKPLWIHSLWSQRHWAMQQVWFPCLQAISSPWSQKSWCHLLEYSSGWISTVADAGDEFFNNLLMNSGRGEGKNI